MSPNLLALPKELRHRIYELVLINPEWIELPAKDCINRASQSMGLLLVNKRTHREASRIFYSQNRFDLSRQGSLETRGFLRQIRRRNAESIRHICIRFPWQVNLTGTQDDAVYDGDIIHVIMVFGVCCTNLVTLTMQLNSWTELDYEQRAKRDLDAVKESLREIEGLLGRIKSLQSVAVRVKDSGDGGAVERHKGIVRKEIMQLGWKLNQAELDQIQMR